MADVHIVLGVAGGLSGGAYGARLPVLKSVPKAKQRITNPTATTQSTITSAVAGDIWQVTATGGNVWVKFGANPSAAVGDDRLVLDGQTHEWEASSDGEKIAVING